jgi:hypothetical protein
LLLDPTTSRTETETRYASLWWLRAAGSRIIGLGRHRTVIPPVTPILRLARIFLLPSSVSTAASGAIDKATPFGANEPAAGAASRIDPAFRPAVVVFIALRRTVTVVAGLAVAAEFDVLGDDLGAVALDDLIVGSPRVVDVTGDHHPLAGLDIFGDRLGDAVEAGDTVTFGRRGAGKHSTRAIGSSCGAKPENEGVQDAGRLP